jgi:hypothetical protein
MFLGAALSVAAIHLAGRGRRADLPPRRVLAALALLVLLMAVDGINSYLGFFEGAPQLYRPANWLRLATGLGAGLGLGMVMSAALAGSLWDTTDSRPALSRGGELLALIVAAAGVAGLVLSNRPLPLYVLGLASAAGVLLLLTGINAVLWLQLSGRNNRAVRPAQALAPLAVGLGGAVLEVALVAAVRYGLTGTLSGPPGL